MRLASSKHRTSAFTRIVPQKAGRRKPIRWPGAVLAGLEKERAHHVMRSVAVGSLFAPPGGYHPSDLTVSMPLAILRQEVKDGYDTAAVAQ